MINIGPYKFDPRMDLTFERIIDITPEQVWKAWTTPAHVTKWFTPAPWKTIDCEIDLRPGGMFRTTMQSPEGEKFPNMGCYLEIIENKKLVWTSALLPGFRPVKKAETGAGDLLFTAMILLEPHGKGTKYTAVGIHSNEQDCKTHREMGFEQGWGMALDQLVAHMKIV